MPTSRGVARRMLPALAMAMALALAGLVLLVSGTGYGLLAWSDAGIERVDAFSGVTDRPAPDAAGATTFLLVGSDTRTGMTKAEQRRLHVGNERTAAGRRADTMMVVHVSAEREGMTVVSLPRDSYVTIPEHRTDDGDTVPERRDKLNAAYSAGGAPLTVATVERSTGLRMDHYLEVDFLGFERLVDSVGGVTVCSPTKLRDRKAGLRLPAGVSHVDGETGLAYVRARNLDARADLGRIERQQRFLAAMAHRVTSRDVLLDPRVLVRFLDAALGAVRADPDLERRELVELATRSRHLSGRQVRFLTVPIADPSHRSGDVGAVALWDERAAAGLFASLRDDRAPARRERRNAASPTVPPSQVRVQVYNGAGIDGLGSTATRDLTATGFAAAGPAQNWTTTDVRRTVIRYDARYTESIKTLARALPGARLEKVVGLGRTLQVVVGSSYDGARAVRVVARPASTGAAAPARPRTADDDPCG
ncbi:MAG: LCP family protein [Actinomycetes bacterium]